MPVGYGVDNYRLFVLDVETSLMLGSAPPMIFQPAPGCLTSQHPEAAKIYVRDLEGNNSWHRLVERTGTLKDRQGGLREAEQDQQGAEGLYDMHEEKMPAV